MEIGVKQAAELLGVSDKTVYRWVAGAQVPFYRVGAQYRFSKNELLSWAASDRSVATGVPVGEQPAALFSLKESLQNGGIFYRVGGNDVFHVLEEMVGMMRLPAGADRAQILKRLYERELVTTTGVGDGVAFPHCRDLSIPGLHTPMVALGFLEQPIDFAAIDKKRVGVVFVLLNPSATASIRIMSRLAHAVRQPNMARLLSEVAGRDQILKALAAVDRELGC